MPNIIIEYTSDSVSEEQINILCDSAFSAVVESGLFEPGNIKLRAIPIEHYRLAGSNKGFIHIQCRMHKGRDTQQKKQLTQSLVETLKGCNTGVYVITAEVVEMDTNSYSKYKTE